METIDKCSNMFGSISNEYRNKIEQYINKENHTSDEWADLAGVIIDWNSDVSTVWQAVIALDPSFPRSGRVTTEKGKVIKDWEKIPSGFTVARAIHNHFNEVPSC